MVSPGKPSMKYSLRPIHPLSKAAVAVLKSSSSVMFLLMIRRSLSLPAYGAKVSPVFLWEGRESINSTEKLPR